MQQSWLCRNWLRAGREFVSEQRCNQSSRRDSVSKGAPLLFKPKEAGMTRKFLTIFFSVGAIGIATALLVFAQTNSQTKKSGSNVAGQSGVSVEANSSQMIAAGRKTFRFDTFGDEAFWGDTLRLHQAIEGAALGGVGPGVSPATALAVGLKVDSDALPASVIQALKA